MDLERTDNGVALKQVLQGFANAIVLLPLITLCVVSRLPKAERQSAIRVCVRYENNLIHEPGLFFQIGNIFSLMALESSLDLPCLLTNSTTRVNMDALLSVSGGPCLSRA
jgi:hypothetical protein